MKHVKSKSKKVEKTVLSNEFRNREDWWSAFKKTRDAGMSLRGFVSVTLVVRGSTVEVLVPTRGVDHSCWLGVIN